MAETSINLSASASSAAVGSRETISLNLDRETEFWEDVERETEFQEDVERESLDLDNFQHLITLAIILLTFTMSFE